MMKKSTIALAVGIGAAALLFVSLSSCTIVPLLRVQGYVLNSAGTGGIQGATVTLVDTTDTSVTYNADGTTASDGSYSVAAVPPGSYSIDVSLSGYFFPPTTVTLGSWQKTPPNIPGIALTSANASTYALSFILMWDNSSVDLDLSMTYPPSDLTVNVSTGAPGSDNQTYTYPYMSGDNYVANWSSGFGVDPNVSATTNGRPITNYYAPSGSNSNVASAFHTVTLDADNYASGGPVVITMHDFPFTFTTPTGYTTSITQTSANGLLAFGNQANGNPLNFHWYGAAELYVSTRNGSNFSTTYGSSSPTAHPVVYVIQTVPGSSGPAAVYLGKFAAPENTSISAMSLATIQLFRDNEASTYRDYFILPDSRLIAQGAGTDGVNLRSVTTPTSIAIRSKIK